MEGVRARRTTGEHGMSTNRREFLAACGGLAVAGIARAQPESEEAVMERRVAQRRLMDPNSQVRAYPAEGPRIRKALKYGMIGAGATVAEKFAIVREAGFDGVEMDSPNTLDNEEILKAREEAGIEIPGVVDSVHWNKPLSHPDPRVRAEGRHALETALHDCKTYGGTTALLVPAVVNSGISYAEAWDRSMVEIKRVVPIAEGLGVQIAFENVWNNFLLSPLEAARYVDELGAAGPGVSYQHGGQRVLRRGGHWPRLVGWYFDIGNIVNYGWPEHWIDALGSRILKLDVKDYSRKKRNEEGLWKGFDVEIGEGDAGWERVNAALDRIGFRGWASAEVGGGGPDRLKEIATRMDEVFDIKDK